MLYVAIICSFMGGTNYDCDKGLYFEDIEKCQDYAMEVDGSKGLTAYCVADDDDLDIDKL